MAAAVSFLVLLLAAAGATPTHGLRRAVGEVRLRARPDESLEKEHRRARPVEESEKKAKIPMQLILTGKETTLEQVNPGLYGNVMRILQMNPGVHARWFSDAACAGYLEAYFYEEFLNMFNRETQGSYRGDICRTAVLLREGGFYADMDLDLKLPFEKLVDKETSFMSVYAEDHSVLNALIGVMPHSVFMNETMKEMRKWYRGAATPADPDGWGNRMVMGPVTMLRALRNVVRVKCPTEELKANLEAQRLQWKCGSEVLRFYQERGADCKNVPCSKERQESQFAGSKYAIFAPGVADPIGWSRFAGCNSPGCTEAKAPGEAQASLTVMKASDFLGGPSKTDSKPLEVA